MDFGTITRHDCIVSTTPPKDPRCSDPVFALEHPDICGTNPGGTDPRCQDPAFAIENPSICAGVPRLVVKPGTAFAPYLGSVQFAAFLVTNGVEQDVTKDCIWSSADLTIALIGAISGNATGVGQGEVGITATLGALTASAELTVFAQGADCSNQTVGMMLLVDTSRSMGQTFASNYYASRLDFAKAAAGRFASEVNQTKDTVGLMTFNDLGVTTVASLTSDKAAVDADVAAIAGTQQITSFYDALTAAIAALNAANPDLKVIVLFSDGEDTGTAAENGYTDATNPVLLAKQFKEAGGVIICMGCRASGDGFNLLSAISTGGFFVNAYNATAADALNYLSGLKGYVCAGNCTPTGDVIVGEGALNYNRHHSFINWDVTGGDVDLIGNGFFDFLPGNGLYVDLAGSNSTPGNIINGRMVSNSPFTLTAGHSYRLSVMLAGNQRQAGTPYSAKVQVFYLVGTSEVALLSQVIIISDYTQDFEPYSFTFTAPDAVDAYISIQELDIPSENNPNFGLLLGQVKFTDTTYLSTLLDDNFDGENQVYIPPACGQGTTFISGGYSSGYNCYGEGCLDQPPAAQSPDPSPLPNIETGGYTPPKVYTSTQVACASCPDGSKNVIVAECASSAVEGAGGCSTSDPGGPGAFPMLVLTPPAGSSIVSYTLQAGATASQSPLAWQVFGSDNLDDESAWVQVDARSGVIFAANETKDFDLAIPAEYANYRLRVYQIQDCTQAYLLVQKWALSGVTIAADQQVCSMGTGTGSSQQAADDAARAAGLALAQPQLNCMAVYSATESVTLNCPTGTFGPAVQKSATATSFVSQQRAEARALAIATALAQADIDADCKLSNNDQLITLPQVAWNADYYGQAVPFSTVKFVTGAPTTIAKVTATLNNISHGMNGNSFQILLRSPSGTWVILWSDLGTVSILPGGTTIIFDDTAIAMPSPIADGGVYRPNNGGLPPVLTMPAGVPPAGSSDYKFTLAAFNGEDANGGWALYAVCRLTAPVTIDGWDLRIT